MSAMEEFDFKIFDMFQKQWALVTAGSLERFNACTVAWGSLGTLWTKPGKNGAIATVYLHPSRYTCELMLSSSAFTVSFFPETCRNALGYMGSHSGRSGNKTAAAGITPIAMGESVTYEEANLTFLCRKLYQHQMSKNYLATDIQEYYQSNPKAFPPDEKGEWQPHWMFIGEIIDIEDKR